MSPNAVLAGLLFAAIALGAPAFAATFHVDDSASQVLGRDVRMKWREPVPVSGRDSTVAGKFTVAVRLDVAPWRGQSGRIYLTLPVHPMGPLTASWTSRGRLLPGVLRAGERALVYAGPIEGDRLEDTLEFLLEADGRRLDRDETLEFSFEIDTETP